jgi:hypothetical protein
MTIQKTSKGRLRVEIDPSIHKRILNNLPEHKRSQPLTHIVNDLIHEALDRHVTLEEPSPSGTGERGKVLSSIYKDKEKDLIDIKANQVWLEQSKNKQPQYSESFEQFWLTYKSSPNKAGQSKTKTWEEWPKAVEKAGSAQKLILAAQKAVEEQRLMLHTEDRCLMLPDAFRWLRDAKFEALLEDATLPQEQQSFNSPVIL